HQARGLHRVARAVGTLEPAVATLEVAQLVRSARSEQRRQSRRRADLEGEGGFLLGAAIAPFVVGLQGGSERTVRPLSPATDPIGAHAGWQGNRLAHETEESVQQEEAGRGG